MVKDFNKIAVFLVIGLLTGCAGSLGDVDSADSVERGLSYIAAAIVTHAVISLFR